MKINEQILVKALTTFGSYRQQMKTAEECCELSVALHHFQDHKVPAAKVIEELADVLIMANQMRLLFGPAQVDAAVAYKMDRLSKRMGAGANGMDWEGDTAMTPAEALAQWPQVTALSARLKAAEHLLFLAQGRLPVADPIHQRIDAHLAKWEENRNG